MSRDETRAPLGVEQSTDTMFVEVELEEDDSFCSSGTGMTSNQNTDSGSPIPMEQSVESGPSQDVTSRNLLTELVQSVELRDSVAVELQEAGLCCEAHANSESLLTEEGMMGSSVPDLLYENVRERRATADVEGDNAPNGEGQENIGTEIVQLARQQSHSPRCANTSVECPAQPPRDLSENDICDVSLNISGLNRNTPELLEPVIDPEPSISGQALESTAKGQNTATRINAHPSPDLYGVDRDSIELSENSVTEIEFDRRQQNSRKRPRSPSELETDPTPLVRIASGIFESNLDSGIEEKDSATSSPTTSDLDARGRLPPLTPVKVASRRSNNIQTSSQKLLQETSERRDTLPEPSRDPERDVHPVGTQAFIHPPLFNERQRFTPPQTPTVRNPVCPSTSFSSRSPQLPESREPNQEATSDDEQASLLNFFTVGAPLPKIAERRRALNYESPAKYPKLAHYKKHEPEEQVKYVEDYKARHNEVIALTKKEEDSDSDDESSNLGVSPLPRIFKTKEAVFERFDFEYRPQRCDHLPVYLQKDKIISAIDKNQVVIVDGFTGCGKTTQVPQFILDDAFERKRPCNVVVTQPRRLAATSVARRICEERGWDLGTVVGYQVGLDKKTGDDTLVSFMTTGVLLQKLIKTRSLRNFSHIIIDEVHERDLETDLLLLFIKKILMDDVTGRQNNTRLILMSATINTQHFSEYFKIHGRGAATEDETPVVKIPASQRRFRVDEVYLDDIMPPIEVDEIKSTLEGERVGIPPELYQVAVKVIVNLDTVEAASPRTQQSDKRGSVLVFLPGIFEIKTLKRLLENEEKCHQQENNRSYNWNLLPLHSTITLEEQGLVFQPPKDNQRKIILSTNIAESSVTVPDIVYVVDFCLTKANCVDSQTNFSSLRLCWTSVHQCIQRKGRTGRVQDGRVYRMVPRSFFSTLHHTPIPEMQRCGLEHVVLQVKVLDMGSPQELLCLALDPPDISGIERAVASLKEVGAMTVMSTRWQIGGYRTVYDTCDGDLTYMGKIMAGLPISPQCTRLIMLGYCFGVLKEAIIVAASLSGKSPFSVPFDKQLESYLRKLNWCKNSYSDCFAMLIAYQTWRCLFGNGDCVGSGYIGTIHKEKHWCRAHYIQLPQMRDIRNLVEELEARLSSFGIQSVYASESDSLFEVAELSKESALMLKIAIAGAFYPNYFQPVHPCTNRLAYERTREVGGNDIFTTVYYKNFPSGNNRHKGELYAKYVSDELSYGISVPYVKFDGQKVFAIFDGQGNKMGPIHESIYRAVKKRQIRHQLEFSLLGRTEEGEAWDRHQRMLANQSFLKCPNQMDLPGIEIPIIHVCVTYVETPSQFWVVPHNFVEKLDEMAKDIDKAIALSDCAWRGPLYNNSLVLAPFRDEVGQTKYFRAKLQTMATVQQCLVYFIDYGNSVWVDRRNLKCFPERLRRYMCTPAMAVECRLSETKPSVIHGSVWTQSATNLFKRFIENMQVLRLKIFAVDKSVIIGELLNTQRGDCINNILKHGNFADHTPETYTATLNHRARSRIDLIKAEDNGQEQIAAYNSDQVAQGLSRDFVIPPRGQYPCKLKGPFSPIEMNFQSLCHSSTAKQVTVDNHSVNSVILDHEPNGATSKLLVASTVHIQTNTGKVVARETTLIPSIPGMFALMALVFSPRAELRCDPHFRSYTGALCGLGTNPRDHEPVYMDHDLEVVFDTEIDDEDICLINQIRCDMNRSLREDTGLNPATIRGDLAHNMMQLLKRNRKKREQFYPSETFVWEKIPPEKICYASPQMFPVQPLDIFKPHNAVQLRPDPPDLMTWEFAI